LFGIRVIQFSRTFPFFPPLIVLGFCADRAWFLPGWHPSSATCAVLESIENCGKITAAWADLQLVPNCCGNN
jgi:hypothetical protein